MLLLGGRLDRSQEAAGLGAGSDRSDELSGCAAGLSAALAASPMAALPLPPLLVGDAQQLDAAQARYVAEVLHPLLSEMAREALQLMPQSLAGFLALWLLRRLGAPCALAEQLAGWLGCGGKFIDHPQQGWCCQEREAPGPLAGSRAATYPPSRPASAPAAGQAAAGQGAGLDPRCCELVRQLTLPPPAAKASWRRRVSAPATHGGTGGQDFPAVASSPSSSSQGARRRPRPSWGVSVQEASQLLRGVPLFEQLGERDLQSLARCAEVCVFEPEADIVRRGDWHEALHTILSGEGVVSVPQVAGTLRRGDSFGEHALVRRHLPAGRTISVGGNDENGELATLAIKYEDVERLGLLSRLHSRSRPSLTSGDVVGRPSIESPLASPAASPSSEGGRRKGRRSGCAAGAAAAAVAAKTSCGAAAVAATAPAAVVAGAGEPGGGGGGEGERLSSKLSSKLSSNGDRLSVDGTSSSVGEGSLTPVALEEGGAASQRRRRRQHCPEERMLIVQAIRQNIQFFEWLQLSESQVEMMADLMYLTTAEPGQDVVKKDEQGSMFYIVRDGVLEVSTGEAQTEMAVQVHLRSGDSFGELALIYNCPRKATVRALRHCQLWTLERRHFRAVMRLRSEGRIGEYARLIESVALLSERLSASERHVLADALEEVFLVLGEEVVMQGGCLNTFFIVFEGCCEVRVNGELRSFLQKGDYYGERALLGKEPKGATVLVTTETATLLTLDSASFHLLLGDAMTAPLPEAGAGPSAGAERKRWRRCNTVELIQRLLGDLPGAAKPKVPWDNLEGVGSLGFGSFGRVTLQRDRQTGTLYALKALSKGYIKRESMQEHVLNERKTMEMLDSKFVVRLHCTYRCPQYVYFLLDPALGGELYDVYVQNSGLFGSEAHAMFYAVCSTLGVVHLHERRIIYRDLKLENVLLYSNGYACLTDFGLAKVVIGKTYTVCGTADYFAPETLRQVGHNRAVDWWALGIMIFITMAGRSPFDAEDVMQIYRNIVKGFKKETFPSDFGEDLVDLISALCRKKPERRLPMGPGGAGNIQAHPWFRKFPWDLVSKRTLRAPYQPPEPDFATLRAALEHVPPKGVEFVMNNPETDNGWDADF